MTLPSAVRFFHVLNPTISASVITNKFGFFWDTFRSFQIPFTNYIIVDLSPKICSTLKIPVSGDMIDGMTSEQLADVINSVSVIYRSTPRHKMKVIKVSSLFCYFHSVFTISF